MGRNRKYQSTATRFGPALKAFLLCLLIGGSGVGYVWQKSQITELGKQRLKAEQKLAALLKDNAQLTTYLNTMRLPSSLEKSNVDMKLGLGRPQQSQFWHLHEPSREATRDSQLAAHESSTAVVP
jgi:hypothetical protein